MRPTDERILAAIRELSNELGWSPSVRELAARVGIKSSATMQHRLNLLEQQGLVARGEKGQPRALRVPPV